VKDVTVEIWGFESKTDFNDDSEEPVHSVNTLHHAGLLDPSRISTHYAFISKTTIDYLDSWLPFVNMLHSELIGISHITQRPEHRRVRPDEFYNLSIIGPTEQTSATYEVETLIDVMGDLGGLIEIILIFTAFCMANF
jgi:hypothetical protein